jgi:hypothetical protein
MLAWRCKQRRSEGWKGGINRLDSSKRTICWDEISGDVKLGRANVSSRMVAGVVFLLHCAHVLRLRGGKQVLHTLCTNTSSVGKDIGCGLDDRLTGIRFPDNKRRNYRLCGLVVRVHACRTEM